MICKKKVMRLVAGCLTVANIGVSCVGAMPVYAGSATKVKTMSEQQVPKMVLDMDYSNGETEDKMGHACELVGTATIKDQCGLSNAKALGLKGDGGYRYQIDSEDYKDIKDSFTIESYFRLPDVTSDQCIFSNQQYAGMGLEVENGNVEMWCNFDAGKVIPKASIHENEWTHVVATYDGAELKLYVNGECEDTLLASGSVVTPAQDSWYYYVGADVHTNGSYDPNNPVLNNSFINRAKIYADALSEDEIKELYQEVPEVDVENEEEQEQSSIILEGDQEKNQITFGVVSDTHVTANKPAEQERLKKAMEFFAENNADASFVVGDLTDRGLESELATFKNIMDSSEIGDMRIHAVMGNHEHYNTYALDERVELFEKYIGSEANSHYKINGIHFIGISPNSSAGNGYDYILPWLKGQLKIAKADTGDKPIFVFFHHPIKDTMYVSTEWYGTIQKEVFNDYPQVVTFSGHIHSPNNNPTSIWQDNFTAINTVTLSYLEELSGYGDDTYPSDCRNSAQGLLVSVDDTKVVIKNYDFISNQYIAQTWSFDTKTQKTGDTSTFPYNIENRAAKAVAPEFSKDAKIYDMEEKDREVTFTFNQASIVEGDIEDDIVYAYEFVVVNEDGEVVSRSKDWSDYHITPMPSVLTRKISGLKPGCEYTLNIYPINAYMKKSVNALSTKFKTTGTAEIYESPKASILDMNLSERKDGADANGHKLSVFGNPEFKTENGKTTVTFDGVDDGIRYTLDPEDYDTIRDKGLSVELYYKPDDLVKVGDPLGNTESAGFGFENMGDGKTMAFWMRLGDSYKKVSAEITANEWNHIIATYDGSTLKMYVNGEFKNSVSVSGNLVTPPPYLFIGGDTTPQGTMQTPAKCEYAVARLYAGWMNGQDVASTYKKVIQQTSTVEDTEKPVGVFQTKPATQTVVGEEYELPAYNVTDNSGFCTTVVTLQQPKGEMVTLSEEDTKLVMNGINFKVEQAGYYTITYTSTDKAGNQTVTILKVRAKAAVTKVDAFAGIYTAGRNKHGDSLFDLKLRKASGIVAMQVHYSLENATIKRVTSDPRFTILNHKLVNSTSGTITLLYNAVGNQQYTCLDNTSIVSFQVKGEKAKFIINSIDISVRDALDTFARSGKVVLEQKTAEFTGEYDINGDGRIDLNDLGTAQKFIGVKSTQAELWAEAKKCDYDGNGIIDMVDYRMLVSKIVA